MHIVFADPRRHGFFVVLFLLRGQLVVIGIGIGAEPLRQAIEDPVKGIATAASSSSVLPRLASAISSLSTKGLLKSWPSPCSTLVSALARY